jgi:hypothetical protein
VAESENRRLPILGTLPTRGVTHAAFYDGQPLDVVIQRRRDAGVALRYLAGDGWGELWIVGTDAEAFEWLRQKAARSAAAATVQPWRAWRPPQAYESP